eukprot:4784170-Pleurochrysis_carterae.AAC.9
MKVPGTISYSVVLNGISKLLGASRFPSKQRAPMTLLCSVLWRGAATVEDPLCVKRKLRGRAE